MTDQPEPVNDMRELYAVQHAITDAGGTLTPAVHKALDALRETWDRELRRAQAEVFQYRTALQGTARAAAPPPADRAAVLLGAAEHLLARCPHLGKPDALRKCTCPAAEELLRLASQEPGAADYASARETMLRRLAAEAQQPDTEARVVAYRSPGTRTLYCVICARQETGWQPVTDADDQAVCDFCGGRVHAVAAQTLGEVVARYLPDAAPAVPVQPAADGSGEEVGA